jgi:YVTN family beta-propeller protein
LKPLRLSIACFAALLAFFSLTAASAFARSFYVTSAGTKLLSVLDTQTGPMAAPPTAVGTQPEAVAIAPGGKTAYVANKGSDTVSVVDTTSSRVLATIAVGDEPDAIAITPDGKKVYVANNGGGGSVSAINTATNAATEIQGVGAFARGVAITPDGKSAYVASEGSQGVAVIDVAKDIVRVPSINTEPAVEHAGATGVAVSPDGKSVYVTNQLTNNVAVINTETETVKPTRIPVGLTPTAIAVTPDGKTAYVANSKASTVSIIDSAAGTANKFVIVGSEPHGIAVDPNGKFAYVVNQGTNNVSVIDVAANTAVADRFAVGASPTAIAVTPNQAPAAELTFTENPIHPGDSVTFDASGSEDDEGVASYEFSFGDGKRQTGAAATATQAFAAPGTYAVTVKTTDALGCSTPDTFLFGGQTAFCNGLPTAQITRQVTVTPAPPAPPGKNIPPTTSPVGSPTKPKALRVALSCPKGTQPKGCQFTVQAVSAKPTNHRKATPLSSVAKAKAKAGKSATVTLLAKPAYAARLATAKTVLVKETVTAKGKTSTRYLRLRAVR